MDNIKNKTFINLITNKKIKVTDVFDNIVITDDGRIIDMEDLMNDNIYVEYTQKSDVNMNKNINDSENLKQNLKKIENNFYRDIYEIYKKFIDSDAKNQSQGETTVKNINLPEDEVNYYDETLNSNTNVDFTQENENLNLKNKYKDFFHNNQNDELLKKQNEYFSKLLNEENYAYTKADNKQERVKNETNINKNNDLETNPMYFVFKNVKRNEDFKVPIEYKDKIPKIDFIKMMEESYEISIIEYLADEFTKKLLENPESIKQIFIEKLREKVYNNKKPKKTKNKNKSTSNIKNRSSLESSDNVKTNDVSNLPILLPPSKPEE